MEIKDMFINCYFKLEREKLCKLMSEQEHILVWKLLISDSQFNDFFNEYIDSLNEKCKKTGQSIKKILISTMWTEERGTVRIIVTTVEGSETISPDIPISYGDFDAPAEIVKNGHDLKDKLLHKAMRMNTKGWVLTFLLLIGLIATLVAIVCSNEDIITSIIQCSLVIAIWGGFMMSNLYLKIYEKIIYPKYVETKIQYINLEKK